MDVSHPFQKEIPGIIADFTPGVGDVKGFHEAAEDPTLINVTAAAVGVVPVAGDFLARGLKSIRRAVKPINLPSWKNIDIDMEHVLSGHVAGGSRASSKKDLFPDVMSEKAIEKAIRQSYRGGKRIKTQGERVLVRGEYDGLGVEMWVNTKTNRNRLSILRLEVLHE